MKLYVLNRNIKFTFLWDQVNTIETIHLAGILSKSVSIQIQLIQSKRIASYSIAYLMFISHIVFCETLESNLQFEWL